MIFIFCFPSFPLHTICGICGTYIYYVCRSEMPSMAAIFAIGSDKPIPELPESCSKLAREFVASCLQRCV